MGWRIEESTFSLPELSPRVSVSSIDVGLKVKREMIKGSWLVGSRDEFTT